MTSPLGGASPGSRGVIWPSLALGLAAAGGELFALAWQKHVRGGILFTSPHTIWLTPLSHLVLFLIVAVYGVAILRIWPGSRRGVLAAVSTLALFALTSLAHPRIHLAAGFVIALGGGIQVSRWIDRINGHRIRQFVSAGTLATVVTAILALLMPRIERDDPRPDSTPSVLLLILDTVRAASLGLYGGPQPNTPALKQLAARGITWDRAIATSPWTLPSHASILTGVEPHLLSANWEVPLDESHATLAELFSRRGYRTAGFVGNKGYASRATGIGRGFAHFEDYVLHWTDLLACNAIGRLLVAAPVVRRGLGTWEIPGRRTAAMLNHALLTWIDRDREHPFFAMVNYYDAHEPLLPPAPWDSRFGSSQGRHLDRTRYQNPHMAEREFKHTMSARQNELERLAYEQSIAWLDHEIGRLVDSLEARGLAQRTIIAVTSDHGELWGEHNLHSHGNSLYLDALHVPLVIAGPGMVPRGSNVRTPVSLLDLGRTLLDVSGGASQPFPGANLLGDSHTPPRSSLRPSRNQMEFWPSAEGPMASATDSGWHAIASSSGAFQFADLGVDPTGRTLGAMDPGPDSAAAVLLDSARAVLRARTPSRRP